MRIEEIMSKDVLTAGPEESARDAYARMRLQGVHHLVVQQGKQILGVLSERDLGPRGAQARATGTVGDLMSRPAVQASPDTTVSKAANLLRGRSIGCLPIVDGRKLVGIVTVSDLLELLGKSKGAPRSVARWKPVRRIVSGQQSRRQV